MDLCGAVRENDPDISSCRHYGSGDGRRNSQSQIFAEFSARSARGKIFARIKNKDDDALLRGVAEELESEGIKILNSTLCVPQIVASEGVLTPRSPSAAEWEDVRFGFRVAKEIGRLGIGQTIVVKKQIVVAVEALEGTDAAIERGGKLARSGFVVVKVSKPEQDLRFDVPAVGVATLRQLRETGGTVLAVEAGKTILLEKELLLKQAEDFGISVVALCD